MTSEPTNVDKLRALPWGLASSATLAVFVQLTFFGSVFVLFLDELGLSTSQMGVLLSLLPFTGLIAIPIARAVAAHGYKRTYLQSFTIRNVVTAGLLFTPWVMATFGATTALAFVTVIVAVFAVFRAIGVTASFPWTQEYVPNSVRGKYTARTNFFSTLMGFLAVSLAGFVLARVSGLSGFSLLIGVGVVFGFVSVWFASHLPGGAPIEPGKTEEAPRRDLRSALGDARFTRYLVGVGLFTLATVPLATFLPLFMQDEVGLSQSNVVRLQNGVLLGSLLSSYLWGWFADRYGSKPVMLYGVLLRILLVVGWLLMPRQSPWSLTIALGIAFMQGVADVGWGVGSARLLYVSVVPPAMKADYMALYWAWTGLVGGFSQLIGGRILHYTQGVQGEFMLLTLDPYLPLFLLGLLLPPIAILLFRRIDDDSTVGLGQFAGIFLRGNPLLAFEAVIRYYRAKDEYHTVRVTEKMGKAKSPLTVDELLEALSDPRFNVRFEALISIGHMGSDERLTNALVEVLNGREPALSVVAAWALGRMGDERAVIPLRKALESSKYRSVQAHSSRSLGALGDAEAVDVLLERLTKEQDYGLEVAFASTLGQLQATQATESILALLEASRDEPSQMELALALARLVGDEHYFVQLHRQARKEPGTAMAQALLALRKHVDRSQPHADALLAAMDESARYLAREELDCGLRGLSQVIRLLPDESLPQPRAMILEHCAQRLSELGAARMEYGMLALHAMQAG